MIKLRPYQEKFVSDIRNSLAKNKRIIACAATGSGKSKVFISITRQAVEKGRTVLIVSESLKIYSQIHKEIGDCQNIGNGIKDEKININSKIFVAMAQTLVKRDLTVNFFNNLGPNLLVITDEAHVGTSTKLLLKLQDALHIGFTATPDFRFAKHLPLIYDEIVIGPQPQELVEMGFLSPYHHYARKVVDLSNLKKGSGGDFSEQTMNDAFDKREVYDGLLEDLKKFEFKKCIIFCASIVHCSHIAEKLKLNDYLVSEVHSKNDNSDFELFQFTKGEIKICVSVGILTKGFDFPEIDLVILQRATVSLPLYLQMVGRGSRITENKSKFTVIDYGGNAKRLGLWNFEFDWSKMWKAKQKEKGVAPVKECPKCEYTMAPSIMTCPNCGHEFIKKLDSAHKKETELLELTNNYNSLRGKRITELTAKELKFYSTFTGRKKFGINIAKSKGSDFLKEYAREMNYKSGFMFHNEANENITINNFIIK